MSRGAPSFEDRLYDAFSAFAKGSDAMDGASWVKCLRDSGLHGAHMSTTAADLIFAQIKPKGARKIDFEAFLDGCVRVGERLFPGDAGAFEHVISRIVEASGPHLRGTAADTSGICAFRPLEQHSESLLVAGVARRAGRIIPAGHTLYYSIHPL